MSSQKCMVTKLRSIQGDTLIEVLSALLVVVLATTLLATMVISSTKVTSQNEEVMRSLYEAQSLLSSRSETVKIAGIDTLTITGDASGFSTTAKVNVYATDGYACYDLKVDKEDAL